jgi:hypothetical protein
MISASRFGRSPGPFATTGLGVGHDERDKTDREIEFDRRFGAGHMDNMIKPPTKPSYAALFTIQLAIAVALFALDIVLGPGIGDGIGYSIVLVLCLRNPKRGYALGWAAFATLLVIAAGTILPSNNVLYLDLINRTLEIGTIWTVWFLLRAIVAGRPDL